MYGPYATFIAIPVTAHRMTSIQLELYGVGIAVTLLFWDF